VSRAPLPNSGVTSVGETCTVSWEGITPPSSLVLAHSPLPLGSLLLRFWPRSESPCRLSPIPAAHGSFPTLFRESVLGCWTPCPGGTPCARACFFHGVIGLPHGRKGRLPASILRTTSRRACFRGCRYFVMFRPPSLLAPRIVPTAAISAAGQLGLLRPGLSCFVAAARPGYANRPTSGNWRYGDLHPARLSALSAAPLPDMPPSTTPGSPTPISSRAAVSTLAFVVGIPPRHSQYPRNPFHAGGNFRGFLVHTFATACQFARPPVRI
jgi:hypothetical protein